MYQKEIIYMGLYKDGSRIGNAGFLKGVGIPRLEPHQIRNVL